MADGARPDRFFDLPLAIEPSANTIRAYNIISGAYNRAHQVLCEQDSDPLRLRIHSERLFNRIVPLLKALEAEVHGLEVGLYWILDCSRIIGSIITELEHAAINAERMYVLAIFCHTIW